MTYDQVRAAIRAQPFRPFRAHLADQRSFDIPHPEFAHIFPQTRILHLYTPSQDLVYQYVDIMFIVSIEPINPPASGTQAA